MSRIQQVTGIRGVVVLLVEFPDLKHCEGLLSGCPLNAHTEDFFSDIVFHKMAGYFREVSYGKFEISGDVFGWGNLGQGSNYYSGDHSKGCRIIPDSLAIFDPTTSFASYQYLIVVAAGNGMIGTRGAAFCPAPVATNDGISFNGGAFVSEFDKLGVFAHEFGHALGLPDLYRECGSNCYDDYVGPWDLMAQGARYSTHISSWGRIRLGWLDSTQIRTVLPSESISVALEALEVSGTGVKAVKVRVTDTTYLLLEFRERIGYDSSLPEEGIVMYFVDDSSCVSYSFLCGKRALRVIDAASASSYYHDRAAWQPGEQFPTSNSQCLVVTPPNDLSFPCPSYHLQILVQSLTEHSATILVDYEGYRLTIASGIPNMAVTVDELTYLTDANGALNLKVSFSTHRILIPEVVAGEENSRYLFSTWSDGVVSIDRQITVQSDSAIYVNYVKQFHLTVSTEYGSAIGDGWYNAGSIAYVSLDATIIDTGPSSRVSFLGWTGDASGSSLPFQVVVDGPKQVAALWKPQYYISVISAYGVVQGSDWYDEGSYAYASLDQKIIGSQALVRYSFSGWTGSASGQEIPLKIYVDGPKIITAIWTTQFYVSIATQPSSVTTISGEGWYDSGTAIIIDAPNVEGYNFNGWTINSQTFSQNPLTVTITEPTSIMANYESSTTLSLTSSETSAVASAESPNTSATPGQQARCLIATAAYGSELAGPVQFLREFRDRRVSRTYLGQKFLQAFNNWYYSWAPIIARQENANENLRATVRLIVAPLMGSLYLTQVVFEVLRPLNAEVAVLLAGILASSLIGAIYLTPLAYVVSRVSKRRITRKTFVWLLVLGVALSSYGTLSNASLGLLQIVTAIVVVQTVLISPVALVKTINSSLGTYS